MDAIEAMQETSLAVLLVYLVMVVAAHLLRWERFSHLGWLGTLSGLVISAGIKAGFGIDGFWAGLLVTMACVMALYVPFELLGRRFPLTRPRDVAQGDHPRP